MRSPIFVILYRGFNGITLNRRSLSRVGYLKNFYREMQRNSTIFRHLLCHRYRTHLRAFVANPYLPQLSRNRPSCSDYSQLDDRIDEAMSSSKLA